ncbi:MAG TPA: ABC transporter permease [Terracidiphilus sp.]|jgi:predicted permease
MRWLEQLQMRIRMLFDRGNRLARLNDELREHLGRQIDENLAAGMNAEDARLAALRAFGNPALVREQARQTWSWNHLESLVRDVRYGMRTLSRSRGFALIAIAVMALCIGAATSLFTIVRSVLLRPLPFRDPDHLVMVYEHFRMASANHEQFNYNVVAPGDYYDWRAKTHGFQDMAAWQWWNYNLSGERNELPEAVVAAGATWNLFPLLGVEPALGRSFAETEDRPGGNAVILTWNVFERRFAGDRSIVGRQIHLDGKPFTVVGVLPASFVYPDARVQVWVPYQALFVPGSAYGPEWLHYHDRHQSFVIARLRPAVSLAEAISQVEAVQYRLHLENMNAPVAEDVAPRSISDDLARDVKKPLMLLMGAVACMLLIGCLNVANLLVARGASRQKEVAIRGALGARRHTLIREQLTESLLICLLGGVAGVLLSLAATNWLATAWKDLPSAEGVHLDAAVLAFSCGLVLLAALLAGLLPAVSSTGRLRFAALQVSTRTGGLSLSGTSLRKTLLTVEIAITVVLLIAAGLLLKNFMRLRSVGLGCATDNVLTISYSLPANRYDKPEMVNAFNETLLARLRAMPGVLGAGLGYQPPGAGTGSDDIFAVVEHPPLPAGDELPDALVRRADPGYFSALEIPLVGGRAFLSQDRGDQGNKVIISRELAQKYFPGEDPLGKHLHVEAYGRANYEIVGVVGDTLYKVNEPAMATMYFPTLAGVADVRMSLAVRTASDALTFSVPIQRQIAALDAELPVSDVLTIKQIVGESLGNASFTSTLVLAFGVLSLLLASVGLYGVLSYLVAQRRTEIGIRIALGAKREQVLRLVLLDGLRPALLGLVLGLGASVGAAQALRSLLYGATPLDASVFAAVSATLLAVAALACLVPAWRASRLDPMRALRTE